MTCGVYAIRNKVSGRIYIGSSVDIKRRWAIHRHYLNAGTHHSRILQNSWKKHGESAFVFVILVVLPVDALIDYEQHLIEQLKPSFNIHPNARSPLGVKRSVETRLKLSLAKRGTQPAHLAEYSQQCAGKPAPHVSESNRQRKGPRRPHSPETISKISQAKKGKPNLKNRGIKKPWLAERNRLRSKTLGWKVFGPPIHG